MFIGQEETTTSGVWDYATELLHYGEIVALAEYIQSQDSNLSYAQAYAMAKNTILGGGPLPIGYTTQPTSIWATYKWPIIIGGGILVGIMVIRRK